MRIKDIKQMRLQLRARELCGNRKENITVASAFNWATSEEGVQFWSMIEDGISLKRAIVHCRDKSELKKFGK